ncbi:MAG: NosD domain-containing protein [Candidatus Pacearchaeota archaeon]
MKKEGKIIFNFLLVIGFVIFLSNFLSAVDVTACGTLSSANTIYVLQNDVTTTGTCFTISASNITLDLNGHNIIYGNQSSTGLYNGIFSNRNYTKILNGSIIRNTLQTTTNGEGIYLQFSNLSVVQDVLIQNASDAIMLQEGFNNNFTNITTTYNKRYGVYIYVSSANNFSNVVSNNNQVGIYFYTNSSNNTLTNITANDNSNQGIVLLSQANNNSFNNVVAVENGGAGINIASSKNIFINATIDSNSQGGISFSSLSNNNTFINATANSNSGSGVSFFTSSNNTLTNVTANSNSYGIYFQSSSSNNSLTYCNMSNNTDADFYLSNSYVHSIDTSNVVNYNQIIYYNYSALNYIFNPENTPNAGLIMCVLCTNVTYENFNLNSSSHSGIFFYQTDNSSIRNIINISNFYYGITLESSDNNTLTNITLKNNSDAGVSLSNSVNNSLSNLTATYNGKGVSVGSTSNNNSISNSLFNANNYGPYVSLSSFNYFNNLTVIDSSYDGVTATSGSAFVFDNAANNTINNSQIRRNYNFAFYLAGARQNNITGTIVENNPGGAMKFVTSIDAIASTGNLIYNNFFNNTINYNETGSVDNFFNTTKTLGTNIVGGDYLGGNYWGFSNGTGFSETCTDSDGDDICDTVYDLNDGSYDYLPLKLISIILPTLPESVYSPSGSSSSRAVAVKETQTIPSVSAGGSVSVAIRSNSIDIRNITLFVNTNISTASLVVENLNDTEIPLEFPAGNIYKAFSITANAIRNEQLNNVTIDFRVNKTWLGLQNQSYNNVLLYRIPSNESLWQPLPTVSIKEDDTYYYFSSLSPGFSKFVILISQNEIQCEPSQLRCFNKDVQICSENSEWLNLETCNYGCGEGKCMNLFSYIFSNNILIYFTVGGIIFALLAILFFLRKYKYFEEDLEKPGENYTK